MGKKFKIDETILEAVRRALTDDAAFDIFVNALPDSVPGSLEGEEFLLTEVLPEAEALLGEMNMRVYKFINLLFCSSGHELDKKQVEYLVQRTLAATHLINLIKNMDNWILVSTLKELINEYSDDYSIDEINLVKKDSIADMSTVGGVQ